MGDGTLDRPMTSTGRAASVGGGLWISLWGKFEPGSAEMGGIRSDTALQEENILYSIDYMVKLMSSARLGPETVLPPPCA
jgi:hypothetical protein